MKHLLLFIFNILFIEYSLSSQFNETEKNQKDLNNQSDFFIENKGQWHSQVRYFARMNGLNVWVTDSGVVYDYFKIEKSKGASLTKENRGIPHDTNTRIKGHIIRMSFLNCLPPDKFKPKSEGSLLSPVSEEDKKAIYDGINKQEGYFNYFIGNDSTKWASFVGLFKEVFVKDIYKGIDVRYYYDYSSLLKGEKEGCSLRYDFVIHPGADLSQIKMKFEGVDGIKVNEIGELVIITSLGEIKHGKLFTYQIGHEDYFKLTNENDLTGLSYQKIKETNKIEQVQCRYKLNKDGTIGFETANYDKSKVLIIDPLIYSTFIGGPRDDRSGAYSNAIALDGSGNVFIAGCALSSTYPTTSGAYDESYNGGSLYGDVIVTKLNSTGTTLYFSTFIGGASDEWGYSIALDGSGNAYITGYTESSAYPTTSNAYDESFNGSYDVIVTKLNSTGSYLSYSTFIGASNLDFGNSIALDGSGNVNITGATKSTSYPTTSGAYDDSYSSGYDVIITKLSSGDNSLSYSTFIGGSGEDSGLGIELDGSGNTFIAGSTTSSDYPTTSGAYDESNNGGSTAGDVFVTKLNSTGSDLSYSTFIGGLSDDVGHSIVIDGSGNVNITGETKSSGYPTTSGAYDESYNGGNNDVFVTKLNSNGSDLSYSTFIGGTSEDRGYSIALDGSSDVYISGHTYSSGYPSTSGAYDESHNGGVDIFVTKLSSTGSTLSYSTFIGGLNNDCEAVIALDGSENIYVAGYTQSSDFPTTSGCYDRTHNGGMDVFVIKLDITRSLETNTLSKTTYCQDELINVSFTITGKFNSGNKFIAQLSDAYGDFSSPVDIGSLKGISDGTINATIPKLTPPGTKYRIRVVSDDPSLIGTDNGTDITINPLPKPAITGIDLVCANSNHTYHSNQGTGLIPKWSVVGGKIIGSATDSIVSITWGTDTTGKVKLVQTNTTTGCKDSIELKVTINPIPSPSITGSTDVCANIETYSTLKAQYRTYLWIVTGGEIVGVNTNNTVIVKWTEAGTGTIKVVETNDAACSDSTKININIKESPIASITGNNKVCIGDSLTYSTTQPAATIMVWKIDKGKILGSFEENEITVRWDSVGEGTVSLYKTNVTTDCKDSSTHIVHINPKPKPIIIGSKAVCKETLEVYTGSLDTTIENYWSVEGGTLLGSPKNGIVNILWGRGASGSMKLIQTNINSLCKDSISLYITLNSKPSAIINGTQAALKNSDEIYYANSGIDISNAWSVTNGTIQGQQDKDTITVKWGGVGSANITLIQTYKSTGCKDTVSKDIIIGDKPTPSITGKLSVCENNEETYSTSTNPQLSNLWSVTGGTINGSSDQPILRVLWGNSLNGSIKLVQTIISSAVKDSILNNININNIPEVSLSAFSPLCIDASAIDLTGGQPAGGIYSGMGVIGNKFDPAIAGAGTHKITYLYNDSIGCSNSASQDIIVIPLPPKPIITKGSGRLSSSAANGNQWYLEGQAINGARERTYKPLQTGNYQVKIKDSSGCESKMSDTMYFDIIIDIPKGPQLFAVTSINYGRVICESLLVDTIDVTNSGDSILTITKVEITGANSDEFILEPAFITKSLYSGITEKLYLKFYPKDSGNKTATLTLVSNDPDDSEFKIQISALKDSAGYKFTTKKLEFNPIMEYSSMTLKDTIINTGTLPITWTNPGKLTEDFRIFEINPITTLANNGISEIIIYYNGGKLNSKLSYTLELKENNCKNSVPLLLDAYVGVKATATLQVATSNLRAKPGDIVEVPIYLINPVNLDKTTATGFDTELSFNSTMLIPIYGTPKGTISDNERTIQLTLPINPDVNNILRTFTFEATLGNDTATTLMLKNISAINGYVVLDSIQGRFVLKGVCMEGGYPRLLNTTGKTELLIARPNPSNETCEIEYETIEEGLTQLFLINIMGEKVMKIIDGESGAGKRTISFDTRDIPSGVYNLILETPTIRKAVTIEILK